MARRGGRGLWKQDTWESTVTVEYTDDPELLAAEDAMWAEWMAEYLAKQDAAVTETVADVEAFLSGK